MILLQCSYIEGRNFRLIGSDSCIVILENSSSLDIYFEAISSVGDAIDQGRTRKQFTIERVGRRSLSTIDEAKRLLAVLSRTQVTRSP